MRRLNGLDLFSGIAGNTLGLSEWVNTVAYCETDRHAQSVLLSRMSDGSINRAPIWDDITTLTAQHFNIPIDIIIGGFPCQDISVAGNGKGLAGERSGLFFEIIRLVKELKPPFVFLENVPAIRTRGLLEVANAFTEIRYDCRWMCITAASVGANHKRERWFLLAHANSKRLEGQWEKPIGIESKFNDPSNGCSKNVAYSNGKRGGREPRKEQNWSSKIDNGGWWAVEPNVGRVANGISFRVDRIKRLGNAVVPLQAQSAFKKLLNLG